MELVRGRRPPLIGEGLERELEIGEGRRVEQLAQLLLAEQLRRRSRSRVSACARRSAIGASPSYMYAAT